MEHFNPRPPCGGRHSTHDIAVGYQTISIHVLRVEDDIPAWFSRPAPCNFNPRPPCGGRQYSLWAMVGMALFQSTSSVWRTTEQCARLMLIHWYFNPRPPCGGRPGGRPAPTQAERISIHVLRVEDDSSARPRCWPGANFNPRPPCGGRPACAWATSSSRGYFNPRPPCGGRPHGLLTRLDRKSVV